MITKKDICMYSIKASPDIIVPGAKAKIRVKFYIRKKIFCKCDVPISVPLSELDSYIVDYLNNGEKETPADSEKIRDTTIYIP